MSAFTQQRLEQMAEAFAAQIAHGATDFETRDDPYKHTVIDNFLNAELADRCLQNFPAPGDPLREHANDADIDDIVYLNPARHTECGGEIGIGDRAGEVCVKQVAPLFDRLVIFDSHHFSFHRLLEPLGFPARTARKSFIGYDYMARRPEQQVAVNDPHYALWVELQLNDKRGNKTRVFK